uniref:Uncharacterized protein n=1 Tax=Periophthalmus magnuspinnatus TaxID=409849 RepID=A0A3B3ZMW1_9GOBI
DISHVLESLFKETYTKNIIGQDTLTNLIKTKSGKNSYHDRYVEELQQAYMEYNVCMQEVDVLETHIIHARTRAAEIEGKECEKMKQNFLDGFNERKSVITQSVFPQCVDKDLLEMNNLISPWDYLSVPKPKPLLKAPEPTKPTVSYSMHISQEPQDDGYTFIPWKGGPSATERTEGQDTLRKMKERQNFLRNPRFLPPNTCSDDRLQVFQAEPPVLFFVQYTVGQIYEATLELKNMTSASRHVRVIPPTTPYFSIGLRFPGEGGTVAPGMSCKYTIRFAPDSLTDFQDFIVVESQSDDLLVVPIEARRPPPVLTPRVLDCGCCLVGGVKFVEFFCQNVGLSPGTFCLIPKYQWPASNLRSVSKTVFTEQPPFAVSPSLFSLQPGETTVVEVVFFPTTTEKTCQVFTIVCDNCQVKDIEGQLIALELISISGDRDTPSAGELHDLTAEHFVCFSPCNPNSPQQKKIVVRNNHLELPFHWQIVKPHLQPLPSGEDTQSSHVEFLQETDDIFHVCPESGLLGPCQDHVFLVTFWPKELKDYHSVCHLVLMDVEIELKGSTEPYRVLFEPYAIVIPGELLICTTTRKQFKMWNHSKTSISFQWERMNSSFHIIEVEPPENECFDLDLIVTGGKPEKVVTSLICHIKHHYKPITLPVEVSFKISVEPSRGILSPLSSGVVDVVFRPRFCQQLQTELELTVENGTGHLSVQASVQSPQVCLLNCELLLSELYMGVTTEATVTLFNQTLLASNFNWHSAQAKKVEEKTHMFVSSLLANGKGAAFFVRPDNGILGAFQTHTVDVTAYTDMWGDYTDNLICKVGDLEPTLIPIQMTVKGCPLYFQMTGPRVDSQNEGPIIRFGTHVSGGDTVSRSLRINNPTTFDIRLDWKTYNIDENDDMLVDLVVVYGEAFPVKEIDDNVASNAEEEERVAEEDTESAMACSHPYHAEKNLISVRIRPHVGNLSDYPYCVTPQQAVIPAKGSSTIHVSFTPLTLTGSTEIKCVGKALGFISLDSETAICVPGKVGRVHGLDLEPVRMNLQAVVKPAEFDIMKSFRLHNTSEMPLQFTLNTQPPFLVKVAFHCSFALMDFVDLANDEMPEFVKVIKNPKGESKLRFQQTLKIHYINGSTQ